MKKIPGHALHEKGLQKQKGVGPLVSNQERRAHRVPRINRSLIARCVLLFGVNGILFVRASGETSRTVVFDALAAKWKIYFWAHRTAAASPRPAPPGPIPPPGRAPPRHGPPVVLPGFRFDRFKHTKRRHSVCQQPGKKSGKHPTDKKRSSIGRQSVVNQSSCPLVPGHALHEYVHRDKNALVHWSAIPGYALHEKRLQRQQISVGPLASSQDRRAAVFRG